MRRLVLLGSIVCIASTPVRPRPRYGVYDVALYLQQCTGHPVFFQLYADLTTDSLPPCERDALTAWLSGRHQSLYWGQDVVAILGPRDGPSGRVWSWDTLRLDIKIARRAVDEDVWAQNDSLGSMLFFGSRALSEAELGRVSDWMLHNLPMPPIELPQNCTACGDPPKTALLKLTIVLDAVRLSPNRPERIVGRISSPLASRLVVGRDSGGRFHLDWASPLLWAYRQRVIYRDANADGTGEIWSMSEWPIASQEAQALSIFDLAGRELTRTAGDCSLAVGALARSPAPLPAACPIAGMSIDYAMDTEQSDVEGRAPVIIHAEQDYPDAEPSETWYRFVGGRYVRGLRPPP